MNRPNFRPASLVVQSFDAVRRSCGYRFPALGPLAYRGIFRVLPRHVDVELVPGVRAELDTADGTQRATYWLGSRFEYPSPQVLRRWADEAGTIFFDIGSNYGWFSFYLASQLPALRVHAFEPNPATFANLRRIVERNALDRITPWKCGLGDEPMIARLRPGVEDSGHSTFGDHPEFGAETGVEVRIQTFDAWRRDIGLTLPDRPLWVAKIDVEGFELRVIRGMREALKAQAFKGLAVEFLASTLEICGTSARELEELLADCGYVEADFQASARRTANKFFIPRPAGSDHAASP